MKSADSILSRLFKIHSWSVIILVASSLALDFSTKPTLRYIIALSSFGFRSKEIRCLLDFFQESLSALRQWWFFSTKLNIGFLRSNQNASSRRTLAIKGYLNMNHIVIPHYQRVRLNWNSIPIGTLSRIINGSYRINRYLLISINSKSPSQQLISPFVVRRWAMSQPHCNIIPTWLNCAFWWSGFFYHAQLFANRENTLINGTISRSKWPVPALCWADVMLLLGSRKFN